MTEDSYCHASEQRETLRRYLVSLGQLDRMFSQSTDSGHPPTPDTVGASPERIDDAEVERELAELEDELKE